MNATRHIPARPLRGVTMFRNVLGVIGAAVALYALWLVQTDRVGYYQVTSASMEPTLAVGSKYVMRRPQEYHVGDIIVFSEPGQDPNAGFFTKRIVATGPSIVELRKGQLYIDGRRNDPPQGQTPPLKLPDNKWEVSFGQFFVAGDNRLNSYDSRDYGPIRKEQIHGCIRLEE